MQHSALIVSLAVLVTTPATAQLIVAHRGASHDAPENTLAAFRLAWEQGADAIEGDFHMSADGHIVCIHDKTTKRTAGVDLVVAKTSLADLKRLDVGRWKDARFQGERIATLSEVLATVPDGKRIFIELKTGPQIVPALARVISKTTLKPEQMSVIAFNADTIAACKEALPHIQAYWLTGYKQNKQTGAWSPTIDSILATLRRIKADGLDTNAHETINAAFVERLRAAKMAFHCWTVDDASVARRFRDLRVDSITTNRPGWLRERLDSDDGH